MKVNVTKENVVITECSSINEGEYRVNKCEFQLPECFDGLTVTAAFDNIPVPLFGGECYIPNLKRGTCTLGVYAYRETEDSLQLMYSPKPTMFYVDVGSYSDSIGEEELPQLSVFERYCKEISENAIHKNSVVDSFDFEEELPSDKLYSVKAVNEFAEIVAQELENDREVISSLGEEYRLFTERVENRVSATEDKIYGLGNSLKGSRSGIGSLTLDDISPVSHSMRIGLSCDELVDYTEVPVIVRGKNLFGFEGRTVKDFGDVQNTTRRSFTGDGIYVGVSGNNYYSPNRVEYEYDPVSCTVSVNPLTAWYGVGIDVPVKEGEVYSVSMQSAQQNARVVLAFYTTQGDYISFTHLANGKFTIPSGAGWMLCLLSSSQASNNVLFKDVQIETGNVSTDFCKYVHPQMYLSDKDGFVNEAESIYPVTIIEAVDTNFTISAEYNRDINAAFNELRRAIAELGGSL